MLTWKYTSTIFLLVLIFFLSYDKIWIRIILVALSCPYLAANLFYWKFKEKWLKIFTYAFLLPFLFFGIFWGLTASIGIQTVKIKHEAFSHFLYNSLKKSYKENPTRFGFQFQKGISFRSATFKLCQRKHIQEKQYPSFEEWKPVYTKEFPISYSSFCPFIIVSSHYTYNVVSRKEYHFWYIWGSRKYKDKRLIVF